MEGIYDENIPLRLARLGSEIDAVTFGHQKCYNN